jgi:hypothetical protein
VICDDIREDLEAYALRALEPVRLRRIASHIETCSECAQIERAYRTAVEHLSLAVPLYRAPVRLRERVLGGIGALRPFGLPAALTSRWALGTAATIFLAFAIGGLLWAITLSAQVDKLRKDNASLAELSQLDTSQRLALLQLRDALNSARTEQARMSTTLQEQATLLVLALDPDLVPRELSGTVLAPAATCNYVWSSAQDLGALTCSDLPSTTLNFSYQLWVTKGEKTLPLGSFLPRIDGSAQLLVKFPTDAEGPIGNLWVTLESQSSALSRPSNEVILQPAPSQQAAR